MKVICGIVMWILMGQLCIAQYTCGTFIKNTPSLSTQEVIAVDRFGNEYAENELIFKQSQEKNNIQTGYFNLDFDNFPTIITNPQHPNFGEDLRPVISQVFLDITQLIKQRTLTTGCGEFINSQTVNIRIGTDVCGNQPDCEPETASVAGVGSPYYTSFFFYNNYPCELVLESNVWLKINSSIQYPAFGADGFININVDNINLHYGLNWNSPVEADKIDLYSVVLHEVLHVLGFASRLNADGYPIPTSGSNLKFYSRYDQLLQIVDQFDPTSELNSGENLLNTDCKKHCFEFNNSIDDLSSLVNNTCGSSPKDLIIGHSKQAAIAGNPTGTVDLVNALSHLSESCNNESEDFVMDATIQKGDDERILSETEKSILCELGYQVQNSNCSGCFVATNYDNSAGTVNEAVLDYYQSCCYFDFYSTVGDTIYFSDENLLCNDYFEGDVSVTDVYLYNNGVFEGYLENDSNGQYKFVSDYSGIYKLFYTVASCSCFMSSNHVEINITKTYEDCVVEACEDVICYGDFEYFDKTNYINFQTGLDKLFLFETAYQNSVDICLADNNKLATIGHYDHPEAQLIELKETLKPGCEIHIQADLSSRDDNIGLFNIFGSEVKPCHPSEAFLTTSCNTQQSTIYQNNCGNRNYVPYCMLVDEAITNQSKGAICPQNGIVFETYNWSIVNESGHDINYLILHNTQEYSMLWIDNLSAFIQCKPSVISYAESKEIEVNKTESIEVEVCLDFDAYPGFLNTDVIVEIILDQPLEFETGGNFENGLAILPGMVAGECRFLELKLRSDEEGVFNFMTRVSVDSLCQYYDDTTELIVKNMVSTESTQRDNIPSGSLVEIFTTDGQQILSQQVENVVELHQIFDRINYSGLIVYRISYKQIEIKTDRVFVNN